MPRHAVRRRRYKGTQVALGTNASESLALPVYAEQILFVVVMEFELTVIGMMQRFADASSQMDVGGGDEDGMPFVLDIHDALEWVFRLRPFSDILDELPQFGSVLLEKISFQSHKSGRELVVYAMAGWTHLQMGVRRLDRPLPAAFVKHRAAFRAYRRLGQLAPGLVGIVFALVKHVLMPERRADGVESCGFGVG